MQDSEAASLAVSMLAERAKKQAWHHLFNTITCNEIKRSITESQSQFNQSHQQYH
jgi:hypothetical protein